MKQELPESLRVKMAASSLPEPLLKTPISMVVTNPWLVLFAAPLLTHSGVRIEHLLSSWASPFLPVQPGFLI